MVTHMESFSETKETQMDGHLSTIASCGIAQQELRKMKMQIRFQKNHGLQKEMLLNKESSNSS